MTLLENRPTDTSVLDGIGIVDCDAHMTEPIDLWTSRAPKSMQDRMPTQRTIDGNSAWFLDGELWCGIGGNTIERGPRKVIGEHIVQPFENVDPAAWDVTARLALMDDQGVDAAIIYPPGRAPYVLVVLTRKIPDRPVAQRLMADISREVWATATAR